MPDRKEKQRPDAKLLMAPLALIPSGWIRLYGDRVESRWGSGSLKGARAHIDKRGRGNKQTYVIIEGPDVSIAQKAYGEAAVYRTNAERFVAEVNRAAQQLEPASETDVADQLKKLGELHDSGVVSDEEFEAKKAELLRRL